MTSREFLNGLGDKGPDFFGVTEKVFKRWKKTGQVPLKASDKILAAIQVVEAANAGASPQNMQPAQPAEPEIDPVTKLPVNLDRRLPEIPVMAGGRLPDTIEISPAEQSFGVNMTRPGRPPQVQPRPPMKLKEVDGQKVAFVEKTLPLDQQTNPDGSPKVPVLPPNIGEDWATKGPPLPTPRKPNEPGAAKG